MVAVPFYNMGLLHPNQIFIYAFYAIFAKGMSSYFIIKCLIAQTILVANVCAIRLEGMYSLPLLSLISERHKEKSIWSHISTPF